MFSKGLEHVCEPYREIVESLLELLLEHFGERLISLVIFGSVARGESTKESDLDLLIIIDGLPRSRLKRQELFIDVEERIEHKVRKMESMGWRIDFSPILKTPEEASKMTPLYLDMVEDALIIYDKDRFFEKILLRLMGRLRDLRAERVMVGRLWYWRLKKDYRFGEVIEIE